MNCKEWVEAKQLLTDKDPAVWLLSRGATLSGTKFHNYVPHYRSFPHLWAINEIRIQVENHPAYLDPDSPYYLEWICERQLRRNYFGSLRGRKASRCSGTGPRCQ